MPRSALCRLVVLLLLESFEKAPAQGGQRRGVLKAHKPLPNAVQGFIQNALVAGVALEHTCMVAADARSHAGLVNGFRAVGLMAVRAVDAVVALTAGQGVGVHDGAVVVDDALVACGGLRKVLGPMARGAYLAGHLGLLESLCLLAAVELFVPGVKTV